MEKYFEVPTQVLFADPEEAGEWCTGIAYQDKIICGCCGALMEIDEVIENYEGEHQPIYVYNDWVNISVEIMGGEFPKDFPLEILPVAYEEEKIDE